MYAFFGVAAFLGLAYVSLWTLGSIVHHWKNKEDQNKWLLAAGAVADVAFFFLIVHLLLTLLPE